MSAIDYTTWPAFSDVQDRLTAAGVTLRGQLTNVSATARQQSTMNAVAAEIGQRTQRQFVADSLPTTRLYDGTGTAEMEVDEMVTLVGVTLLGFQDNPGYPLSGALLTKEANKPMTRLTVSRGSVAAFGPAGVWAGTLARFPAGRQNIQVTGLFGYGPAIPADLWEAAAGEMALRLAGEAIFTPAGRTNFNKAGDEETRSALDDATATGWHDLYLSALTFYKRPAGRRLRNLRPSMI